MLTWDFFCVKYSKYSSQKKNILGGILTFYQGKKCLNCAHCFHVLYDISKLLILYSARKILLKRVRPTSLEAGLLFTLFGLCRNSWTEAKILSAKKLPQQVWEMPGEPFGIGSRCQPRQRKGEDFSGAWKDQWRFIAVRKATESFWIRKHEKRTSAQRTWHLWEICRLVMI